MVQCFVIFVRFLQLYFLTLKLHDVILPLMRVQWHPSPEILYACLVYMLSWFIQVKADKITYEHLPDWSSIEAFAWEHGETLTSTKLAQAFLQSVKKTFGPQCRSRICMLRLIGACLTVCFWTECYAHFYIQSNGMNLTPLELEHVSWLRRMCILSSNSTTGATVAVRALVD